MKYVNNNGSIVNAPQSELQKKTECPVHFSYNKSQEKLMVVDIQGSGYNLTDPDLATSVGSFDETDELLFCVGNLSKAIYFLLPIHVLSFVIFWVYINQTQLTANDQK